MQVSGVDPGSQPGAPLWPLQSLSYIYRQHRPQTKEPPATRGGGGGGATSDQEVRGMLLFKGVRVCDLTAAVIQSGVLGELGR